MDAELSRAEADLHHEEAALHTELSRLAMVRVELSERMVALQVTAREAGEAAIAQRARALPPLVDPDEVLQHARSAREAALQSRRDANVAVRAQLKAAKVELQKLAAQVLADEKALTLAQERALAAAQCMPTPPPAVAPEAPATVVAKRAVPKTPTLTAADAKKPARVRSRVKMQAAVDFTSDDNFFNGFSANISDGGLFVATVNILPLGTEVDLSFSLPHGERVEAKGVVRWVREVNDTLPDAFPGMGVQFSSLAPNAQLAIDHFLKERDPLFFVEGHDTEAGQEGQVS